LKPGTTTRFLPASRKNRRQQSPEKESLPVGHCPTRSFFLEKGERLRAIPRWIDEVYPAA
jgi:hypothetical protein